MHPPSDASAVARLFAVFVRRWRSAGRRRDLFRARARAEVLWQQAPIGVIEATPAGVITSVNDALAQMLGRTTAELVGTLGADLADPAHADTNAATVERLRRGQGYVAERRYLAADGRSVPVHVSTVVLRDGLGAVTSVAGFVIDLSEITAQRATVTAALAEAAAARDELVRRQSVTDALLDTIEVGIVSCDVDGGNLVRNRAERAMVGMSEDGHGSSAREEKPVDLLDAAGELLQPHDYPLAKALRGETVAGVDFRLGPPGGPFRDVVVRGNAIATPDGRPAGAVVALTDVTAERKMTRELAFEHARLNQAQRLGQIGSFGFDVASGEFTFSDQMYRIWGVPIDADLASRRVDLIHPDDLARVLSCWKAALLAGGAGTTDYRIIRPDGELRHLRVSFEVLLDASGEAVTLNGTHLDVTAVTLAEREAVEAGKLFQSILTATPDYTFVTDLTSGAVVYGSPGKSILGITTDELEKLGPSVIAALVHPEEQPRLQAANLAARDLDDGEVLNLRYRARNVDGDFHWLSRRVTPFRRDDTTGEVLEVLGVVRDVTDVVEAEQRLTYTALHDPLTGLPNRALLVDRLDAALARSRHGREVAILFCDLDGFKRVNDTAGHTSRDAVLVETAARLRSVLRDGDTVARVGGDEFVIVVEPWDRADRGGARRPSTQDGALRNADDRAFVVGLAARLNAAVRQPIVVDDIEHVVTVSIGITYAGPGTTTAGQVTADTVLQDADAAMYRAKNGGKDRFEVFEHGLRTDLAERGRVEQVLRQALAVGSPRVSGEASSGKARRPMLTAAYQPVVDVATGALVGFEALARLTDGDGLSIPPDVFVSVAENSALIRPLGATMLDLACSQLATWRRETPGMQHVTMAVNVSALEVQHASWADQVRLVLREHGLVSGDLVLEITETALLHAANSTVNSLRALRRDGVGIALDDFGTGYASLRYLTALPVSSVKIDRSFTAGLPDDAMSCKIVAAVVGLAAELGMTCVVEGVETEEQRSALPSGVQIQGWLTGRPAAPVDLEVLRLILGVFESQ